MLRHPDIPSIEFPRLRSERPLLFHPSSKMDPMEIHFNGSYEKPEFYRAVSIAQQARGQARLSRSALLVFLLLVIAAIVTGMRFSLPESYIRSMSAVLPLALFITWLTFPWLNARRIAGRLWRDPAVNHPFTGTINAAGIQISGANPSGVMPWEQFTRCRPVPGLEVLLTRDGSLQIFPRRFFQSAADWEMFQEILSHPENFAVIGEGRFG